MFKLADAEEFLNSEEISKCNREILQKYFRFLRHEGNSERTAINHMENMVWIARALNKCDLGNLTEDDLYLFFDTLEDYTYTTPTGKIKKYSEPTKETRKSIFQEVLEME